MKQFILLFTLLTSFHFINAQTNEFAPVGAKWWYSNQVNVDSPFIAQILQVESDTTIVGKYCKIITGYLNDTIYIHSEDNVIFQFFETEDKFLKLYDFNLNTGDSYWLHGMTVTGIDSVLVHIENVQDTTINGIELKKQSISIDEIYFDWSNTIIEKIGNTKFLIPIYSIFDLQPGPLRCYEDDELGLVETGIVENCDAIVSISDTKSTEIIVGPNPLSDNLNISFETLTNSVTEFYTISGQRIFIQEVLGTEANFSLGWLPPGWYIMKVTLPNKAYVFNLIKL
jgi:hypothetical protein